jgi:DNA-binding ferritin-like protein
MNVENSLSIIDSYLNKVIMEVGDTTERDWLIDAQKNVKKTLWHIRKDKLKGV